MKKVRIKQNSPLFGQNSKFKSCFNLWSVQVKLQGMSEKDKQNALNEIRLIASVR